MTSYTLFGQAGGTTLTVDTSAYTMGVAFTVSQDCTLDALWWNSPAGAGSLPSQIALYQITGAGTGTLIHNEVPSWSGAAGSGWVRAAFASPPALTAGTHYKAAIGNFSGASFYGGTSAYWTTGPGSAGISNGPLSAPSNAASVDGQDTFTTGVALAYPATSVGANYWIDPEVTPSGYISISQGRHNMVIAAAANSLVQGANHAGQGAT